MNCNCKNDDKKIMKIKLILPDAKVPVQAHPNSDAGYDLFAATEGVDVYTKDGSNYLYTEYDTGIAIELPIGYHGEITPRSSITKMNLMLKNNIGIIDNEYRGNLICRFHKTGDINTTNIYKKGDRIAQLILRKTEYMSIMVVENLTDTNRGINGLGSSGK